MRSGAPPLMPIFRSQHQAELLTRLYLHPEREYTLSELAEGAGVPPSTAHREMARLVEAGLVISRVVGRTRLHRADTNHPGAAALTELLILAFGPAHVVAEEFGNVAGAGQIVLFGSWSARRAGQGGPPPADIDVLIIGAARRTELYAAAERASERLQLPVNPVLRSPEQWAAADDALVAQVRQSEYVVVLDRWADDPPGAGTTAPIDGGTPMSGVADAAARVLQ
jgi:DNA-binding transcriptional ArsR family regulator